MAGGKVIAVTPEGRAAKLLHEYGVTAVPVPVGDIAKAEGVEVVGKPHDGPEYGFALKDGNLRLVGINNRTNLPRQRCATAHGLGHVVLHEAKLLVCCISRARSPDAPSTPSAQEEAEANRFSAALVMPDDAVTEVTAGLNLGLGAGGCTAFTEAVAHRFGVPVELAAYRLAALGLLAI